jgi:hypothetical protein
MEAIADKPSRKDVAAIPEAEVVTPKKPKTTPKKKSGKKKRK